MIPHMARLRSNLLVASFLLSKSVAPVSVSGPPMPRNAQTAMNARKNGAIAYMLRIPCQPNTNKSEPVATGPATSPMLPPTPWKDKAMARRWEKW